MARNWGVPRHNALRNGDLCWVLSLTVFGHLTNLKVFYMLASWNGQMHMCWICQNSQACDMSCLSAVTFLRNFMNQDGETHLNHLQTRSVTSLNLLIWVLWNLAMFLTLLKESLNRIRIGSTYYILNGYKVSKPFYCGVGAGVTKVCC